MTYGLSLDRAPTTPAVSADLELDSLACVSYVADRCDELRTGRRWPTVHELVHLQVLLGVAEHLLAGAEHSRPGPEAM